MAYKKGNVPWMKGKKHSEKSRKKMSLFRKGKHNSPATEFKKGQGIGKNNNFYGRKHTKESIEKMKLAHLGKYRIPSKTCQLCGKLYRNRGKKYCGQECRLKSYMLSIPKEKLYDLYWNKKLSSVKIAEIFNSNPRTISKIMERYNIPRRTLSKAQKNNPQRYWLGKKGENSSAWQGGLSFEPYAKEFNKELKEQIRKRDNYECQSEMKDCKGTLSIHHIDYNKKNNNHLNLITLCKKHHTITNFNRKHWKRYFQMEMFIKDLSDPRNILLFNENKKFIGKVKI